MRNPKQYRMIKIPMIQTLDLPCIAIMILFLSLENLIFEFVSNFGFRISNFFNAKAEKNALYAYAKTGISGLGF